MGVTRFGLSMSPPMGFAEAQLGDLDKTGGVAICRVGISK